MRENRFLKDFAAVTVATAMLGAATCFYVRAGLGSDAVAVFNEGLSIFAGISLGTASWMLNLALLAAAFFCARSNIGWTTIFNSLLTGLFIDLADWALTPVFGLTDAIWYRWILFVCGLVLVAMSCALMMRECPGMSVMDAIASRIAEKLGCTFRIVRMSFDGALMLTGWLMGGVVGFASVIAVLGTGPLIQFFYQFGKKS